MRFNERQEVEIVPVNNDLSMSLIVSLPASQQAFRR